MSDIASTDGFPKRSYALPFHRSDMPLWAWAIYVFTFPLYFFPSQDPQISSVVLGSVFIMALSMPVPDNYWKKYGLTLTIFFAFVVEVFLVDAMAFWYYANTDFILFPLFYLYNFMLVAVGLLLYERYGRRFLVFTTYAAIASFVGCVGLSPLAPATFRRTVATDRAVFFFNNPNQFGYFNMLLGTLILMAKREKFIPALVAQISIVVIAIFNMLTISRAAILMMFVLAFWIFPKRLALAGGVILALVVPFYLQDIKVLQQLEVRFDKLETTENTAEVRHIDRIWNYPEFNFLGAGEGMFFSRFKDKNEMHSVFFSTFFSYGILGLLLFTGLIISIFVRLPLYESMYFMPILAYTTVENGIRFSLGWILVVFVMGLADWRNTGNPGFSKAELGSDV